MTLQSKAWSLVIGIVGSLLATGLLWVWGRSWVYVAVLPAVFLPIAVSNWVYRMKRALDGALAADTELKQLRTTGVVDARPSLEQISLSHQLQNCDNSLDFLGVSARTVVDNSTQSTIRKALASRPSLRLRFLLFDPRETKLGERRAKDETGAATTWTSWSRIIGAVVAELEGIAVDNPTHQGEIALATRVPIPSPGNDEAVLVEIPVSVAAGEQHVEERSEAELLVPALSEVNPSDRVDGRDVGSIRAHDAIRFWRPHRVVVKPRLPGCRLDVSPVEALVVTTLGSHRCSTW